MTYRQPQARVLSVQVHGDGYRITVELECPPWRPLAPASLWRAEDPSVKLAELHRLVHLDGHRGTFETSLADPPRLVEGDVVAFLSRWSSDQLGIARNAPPRPWRRIAFAPHDSTMYYPDGSSARVRGGWDHEHCRLCWATLAEDPPYGYVDRDDWLCSTCYDNYIASGYGTRLGDEV